ncbi:MAG TPA: nuclear transport factor 2 family protein [Rhodanobacteraceae bacterium]|nr:nuclear transport factor 2 family protein [Rhodanobacteraceae bacterium]
MKLTVLMSAGALALAATHPAVAADDSGVRGAENRWSEAYVTGDAATLDDLLDADYVSVNAKGKPRPKAEIIQAAKEYATAHPGQHANPLPPTSTIHVIGDAAVVQHHAPQENSVDVFYFRDGKWHAWYSQHTRVAQ